MAGWFLNHCYILVAKALYKTYGEIIYLRDPFIIRTKLLASPFPLTVHFQLASS